MDYYLAILIQISVYSILAISLNLLFGYAGMLSLCHAGFYGFGAYITAIFTSHYQFNWLFSVFASIIIVSLLSTLIAFASIRFKNDFFIIATFAFQVLIINLFKNSVSITEGQAGISNIPAPIIFGLSVNTHLAFFVITIIFLCIIFFTAQRITKSSYGIVLLAIKEDELYANSLGINTKRYKISIFILSAIFASLAGNIMAPFYTHIEPDSFSLNESIFILTIVIVGGLNRISGSILGAALLIIIPEILGLFKSTSFNTAEIKEILYGIILIVILFQGNRKLLFTFKKQKNSVRM